jgi:indoleamine 2,3-dioxygenase
MAMTTDTLLDMAQAARLLSPQHFLAAPRPDANVGPTPGVADTTTLAAHDFDVDTRTGFMPPEPPLARLPAEWDAWEVCLADSIRLRLQLAGKPDITAEERQTSEAWRGTVRKVRRRSIYCRSNY